MGMEEVLMWLTLAKCSELLAEVWFMSQCLACRTKLCCKPMEQNVEKISQNILSRLNYQPPARELKYRQKKRTKEIRRREEKRDSKKMEWEEAKEQEVEGLKGRQKEQMVNKAEKVRVDFISLIPKCRTSVFHWKFFSSGKEIVCPGSSCLCGSKAASDFQPALSDISIQAFMSLMRNEEWMLKEENGTGWTDVIQAAERAWPEFEMEQFRSHPSPGTSCPLSLSPSYCLLSHITLCWTVSPFFSLQSFLIQWWHKF